MTSDKFLTRDSTATGTRATPIASINALYHPHRLHLNIYGEVVVAERLRGTPLEPDTGAELEGSRDYVASSTGFIALEGKRRGLHLADKSSPLTKTKCGPRASPFVLMHESERATDWTLRNFATDCVCFTLKGQ